MLLNRFFNEPISTTEGLVTLAIVAASVLVGWLFERFAMPKLLDVTRDPAHDFDGLFVRSIRGVTIFWFVIGAFRFAVMGLPLAEHFSSDLDQILRVLLILTVTIALARFVSGSVKIWATRLEGAFPAISIFANLAQITVLLIGGLMALQTFDISVAPLLTALGVGGIAVALALSPTLENFISGLQIIMAKQLRAGDFIEMENGQRGYVDDITWRTTTIKSLGNSMIILPNKAMGNSMIINHYQPDKWVTVRVPLAVTYAADLDMVERICVEVGTALMKEHAGGVPDYEVKTRFNAFAEFAVTFNVIMAANEAVEAFGITHEYLKQIRRRFRDEGIDVPYPVRNVRVHPAVGDDDATALNAITSDPR